MFSGVCAYVGGRGLGYSDDVTAAGAVGVFAGDAARGRGFGEPGEL